MGDPPNRKTKMRKEWKKETYKKKKKIKKKIKLKKKKNEETWEKLLENDSSWGNILILPIREWEAGYIVYTALILKGNNSKGEPYAPTTLPRRLICKSLQITIYLVQFINLTTVSFFYWHKIFNFANGPRWLQLFFMTEMFIKDWYKRMLIFMKFYSEPIQTISSSKYSVVLDRQNNWLNF